MSFLYLDSHTQLHSSGGQLWPVLDFRSQAEENLPADIMCSSVFSFFLPMAFSLCTELFLSSQLPFCCGDSWLLRAKDPSG